MKFINYISMALAVTALASCSSDDLDVAQQNASFISVYATVGDAYSRSNPMGSEEEQKAFVEGDQLTVLTEGQSAATYTLKGNKWSAAQALLWMQDKMTFQAWHPADATFESYTLPVDQTVATEGTAFSKIAKADYMTCTTTQAKAEQLNLTFQRQTARVVVKVTFNKEYQGVNAAITSFVVCANQQAGTGTESLAEFKAYQQENQFTALVAPTSAHTDETFMKMTVTYSDNQTKQLTVKGIRALEKGKSHEFNLAVGMNEVAITNVSITDWEAGTTVDNVKPQGTQPIVDATTHSITVQTQGTLTTDYIKQALKDGSKALTISGKLNGADMKVIREATGCLYDINGSEQTTPLVTDLDLTQAQIVASIDVYAIEWNNEYKITEDNTLGDYMFFKTAVTSIKMPLSVTKLGSYVFRDSQFTEFTIPEKVTTIQDYAFQNSGLHSIIIPETVTYLGVAILRNSEHFAGITIACDKTQTTFGNEGWLLGLSWDASKRVDLKLHPSFKDDVTYDEHADYPTFQEISYKSITDLEGNPFVSTTNP